MLVVWKDSSMEELGDVYGRIWASLLSFQLFL